MNLALLGLRLVLGLTLASHGAQKLFGWFGGGGIDRTAAGYEQIGLSPGRFNAWLAGATELFGGLLLAVGLLTPLAAAGSIGVMTVAAWTVHRHNGFFNSQNGFEYNLLVAAAAFALAGTGPGAWSLSHALGIHLAGPGWALAALAAGVLGGAGAVAAGRIASSRAAGHRQAHAA